MVKLTDLSNMTSAVYHGHRAINQTNKDQLDQLHTLNMVSCTESQVFRPIRIFAGCRAYFAGLAMCRLKCCRFTLTYCSCRDIILQSADTVKPVLSDRIKQDKCLVFQSGGCFLHYFHAAVSNHSPVYSDFSVT